MIELPCDNPITVPCLFNDTLQGFAYCQSFISELNCYMMLILNSVKNIPVVVKLLDTL